MDGKRDAPRMRLHLWIETDEGLLFGLGRAQLLAAVEETGSLNQAAKALRMSYRAAWGKIKGTEEALGQALVENLGGRKGCVLTPLGRELAAAFVRWQKDVETYALDRARDAFPWKIRGYGEGE